MNSLFASQSPLKLNSKYRVGRKGKDGLWGVTNIWRKCDIIPTNGSDNLLDLAVSYRLC